MTLVDDRSVDRFVVNVLVEVSAARLIDGISGAGSSGLPCTEPSGSRASGALTLASRRPVFVLDCALPAAAVVSTLPLPSPFVVQTAQRR
eukprot:CAMPEP_0205919230 /NCGR_PEP_ID=MMETSP1325-20131115/10309_1 /ASSEMBLY_ACC=CAM_ASM_000708 /TAXON_ID=236786 /ORGANISM="Florenciella sp., Strain RCC1007" /LENGTH=89 /DNA_ID=CAMNT_0053286815 /DNA_START=99 /DNA_END=365 /DNA_ORIENTATION=-